MAEEQRLGSSYVLEQWLGAGASGQVWSGRDDAGHPWAFKLLRSELANDPGIVNRFVQERRVLASIRHPNVVQVHDLVVEGSTLAIVMDLVEGHDLRATVRETGTLPPHRIATYGADIAVALHAAHQSGVIHRDVKPENVLIDETNDRARLTDIGVARLVDGSDRSTMLLGTPQYMAPEIAEGKTPTPAVDMYSLGMMLYELCCGVPPFAGRGSAMATLRVHAVDVPGRPEGVPDPLWRIIAALTAKDPAQRPAAGVAADELSGIAPALTGVAAAPRLAEPPPAQTSGRFNLGPGADAETMLGTDVEGAPTAGETVFVDRSTPAGAATTGPPGAGWHPGYGQPASVPSGGYPSGGYPSQGYPSGAYSAPQQPPKRTGALLGAAVGVLLVLTVGLGWVILNGPPQLGSTTSAAATVTSTPTDSTSTSTTSSPGLPPPPPVTVTVTEPTRPTSASQKVLPKAIQQDAADRLVRGYLSEVESGLLTIDEMADYFTATVQWYRLPTRITREEIWEKVQVDPTKPRTTFGPPNFLSFTTGVSHQGRSADQIEYRVDYSRLDMQSQPTKQGNVTVCYVLVPDSAGNPRITRIFER